MRKLILIGSVVLLLVGLAIYRQPARIAHAGQSSTGSTLAPAELDRLLAPIALYPDQLLAQILLCAGEPDGVRALDAFIKSHADLKGTDLQDAVLRDNFEPSFVWFMRRCVTWPPTRVGSPAGTKCSRAGT